MSTTKNRIPPELHRTAGGRPRKTDEELRRWTLQEIREHCFVTINGCWEWRLRHGVTPKSERAQCYVSAIHGGEMFHVRRLAWILMTGKRPDDGLHVVPTKCGNPRCQNPMHATLLTQAQKTRAAAARGAFSTPERAAAVAAGKRASTKTGMTMEKAEQIRSTQGRADEHCAAFGISKSMFNRIRSGNAWAATP